MGYDINIQKTQQSRISQLDQNNIGFGKIFSDHMFLAEYDGKHWTNLRIEPYGNIHFAPSISSLHYGQAIFEGMKAYKSGDSILLFRPSDNAKRLNISAERMCMPAIPEDLFMQGLTTLLQMDQQWVPTAEGSALYIRPFMFSSDEFVGVCPSEKYVFCIFTCPVGPYYTHNLKVKVEDHYTRAASGGTGFTKCAGNYAASLYPAKLAQQEGYDQVLWTDGKTHQYVEETGTTNFFAVIDNIVYTPALEETLLDGITRRSIVQLLKDNGYNVVEEKLPVAKLIESLASGSMQEMFISGTAATLVNIEGLGHQEKYYPISNPNNEISKWVKEQLHLIRTGVMNDKYNWVMSVEGSAVEV